jgi:quinol monooxygenase YgiN
MNLHGKDDTNFGDLANRLFPLGAIPWLLPRRVFRPRRSAMVKVGLFVRLEAKAGKENDLAKFLDAGLGMANQETTTPVWFALRLGPTTFGIFDAFADEAGRQAHLTGPIAKALMANAPELLAKPPQIEQVDVLGAKLP